MRVRLVPASIVHIGPLALNMRAVDRRECAAFGRNPKQALRISLRTSLHALTALSPEGMPVCMFGVCAADMATGKGIPWLLASDELFEYSTDLMRLGPKALRWWGETFSLLENVIAADNHRAIALLERWGFIVGSDRQTIGGVEFRPFALAIQERRDAA